MKKTACKTAVSPKPKPVKSQATPPLRAAIYCRAQDAEANEAQKACLTKMIKANPGWTPAGVFKDIGSASSERPEFRQMLQKCRQNEIDLILTKSVSRFARNLTDYLCIIKILRKLDVAVIFEKDNINTMEPDSSMSITMMGVMTALAQQEAESISPNSVHMRYLGTQQRTGGIQK